MPITQISSYFKGVMSFAFKDIGWSESYPLTYGSRENALTGFTNMVYARSAWMAPGVTIKFARVSLETRPGVIAPIQANVRDASAVDVPYPLGPHAALASLQQTAPNDPKTGVRFRLETDSGSWNNRVLRGISDVMIQNFELNAPNPAVLVFPTLAAFEALGGPGNMTNPVNAMKSYLGYLLWRTRKISKDPQVANGFLAEPWFRGLCRGVGGRKPGRPFGVSPGKAKRRV
jgi:hypothetical protein